jgi:hypothetical protein
VGTIQKGPPLPFGTATCLGGILFDEHNEHAVELCQHLPSHYGTAGCTHPGSWVATYLQHTAVWLGTAARVSCLTGGATLDLVRCLLCNVHALGTHLACQAMYCKSLVFDYLTESDPPSKRRPPPLGTDPDHQLPWNPSLQEAPAAPLVPQPPHRHPRRSHSRFLPASLAWHSTEDPVQSWMKIHQPQCYLSLKRAKYTFNQKTKPYIYTILAYSTWA